MGQHLLDMAVCMVAAVILMIIHELSKTLMFFWLQKRDGREQQYSHSIWSVWRYLDPVGIILSVTSQVVVSKPFMFRIQNKKYNRILGLTGFLVSVLCFSLSIFAIKRHMFGVQEMNILTSAGIGNQIGGLFLQYVAILSAGMFLTNLFPISTFDMGLLIAGFSSAKYLKMIKMDAIIKLLFVLVLLVDFIYFLAYRTFWYALYLF